MDMRTGEIYSGERRHGSEAVDVTREIVTVLTGPFKGRRYLVVDGRRANRVQPDATPAEVGELGWRNEPRAVLLEVSGDTDRGDVAKVDPGA